MKPVLVTGATGFLGGHLVAALRERGHPVRALVRPGSTPPPGVEVAWATLSDPAALERAVEGMDRVFHCAALVSDHGPASAFVEANITGVRHLVAACERASVGRLLHVSTSDVYGHPDAPVDETAPYRLRGLSYGDSKIGAEQAVWAAARRGLPVTVVRPSSIYGPRCRPFVVEVLQTLRQGLLFRLPPPPRPLGLAYVDNVVDALLLAAEHPAALGRAYNVHDGSDLDWNGYIARMAREAGLPQPRVRVPRQTLRAVAQGMEWTWSTLGLPERPPLTRLAIDLLTTHQGFSTDRIRRELGWTPRVDLEEGLERTFAWLRAQDLLPPRPPETRP